jgi:hypothetical protein
MLKYFEKVSSVETGPVPSNLTIFSVFLSETLKIKDKRGGHEIKVCTWILFKKGRLFLYSSSKVISDWSSDTNGEFSSISL